MSSIYQRVLVIDDDFMIANLHGKYIEQQEGYKLVGVGKNYAETMALSNELNPDLLLLDVYLPDRSGLDVLRSIRSMNLPCDVILITAAKEIQIIEEAFRLGIFDYLIKPFGLDLLKETLKKYSQFKFHLHSLIPPDQNFVEGLKKFRATKSLTGEQLPKGLDFRTLERVKQTLMQEQQLRGAEQIARVAGISRSTARTYLDYLIELEVVEEFLQYGTVGRPQRLFRIK
ncbi:response regulator [Peribacillus butanolivorans]|uniref:response regulator n=1 Tax=Peribacillus butanolivorans TaxID=421767 RepID=UPI0035E2600F